jgi:hypothetical protein
MSISFYDKSKGILWNVLRGLVVLVFGIIVSVACILIRLITMTYTDKHKITRFKIWRIRKLTGLKLWFFHNFPDVCRFLDIHGYLAMIDKKFTKGR